MNNSAPKSLRTQIAVFGRTNVGKSSFINMITSQSVSIVSPVPGTTTDVVEKVMEFRPVGPVVFLDTAGIDDASELSGDRLKRTAETFGRADVFTVITESGVWGPYEERLRDEARLRNTPVIAVVNKTDLNGLTDDFRQMLLKITPYVMECSCIGGDDATGAGAGLGADAGNSGRRAAVEAFRKLLAECTRDAQAPPQPIASDLLPPGGLAVLVVPIDSGAPKGRLILPQAQTIRDILDGGGAATVVRDTEYVSALSSLNKKPDLVICDSQVVHKIAAETPNGVPLTTFSILFARFKGIDVAEAASGALFIDKLQKGDRVLIAEACAHHAAGDDIGRVKIPNLLRKHTGLGNDDLRIDIYGGRDYPEDLEQYRLVIHCGACMLTRREMLSRAGVAKNKNVPITNYGMAISYFQGVLERVIKPLGVQI